MTKLTRLIVAAMLAFAVGAGAVACGKEGPPRLPEGQTDDYPRKYPSS